MIKSLLYFSSIIALVACNGLSGDNGAEKFSGNSGSVPMAEVQDVDSDLTDAGSPLNSCGDEQELSLPVGPEIEACLNQGNLYDFNKWADEGRTHKDEYCLRSVNKIDCSIESLTEQAKIVLGGRDKSEYLRNLSESDVIVSCATIGTDRVIFHHIKKASEGGCQPASNGSIGSVCWRKGVTDITDFKSHVMACMEDPAE